MPISLVNRLSLAAACGVAVLLATAAGCCYGSSDPRTLLPAQTPAAVASGRALDGAVPGPAVDVRGAVPSDGFLSNGWRDWLAVTGVVGVVLTALGVWWSWESVRLAARQLQRTTAANEAATAAAIRALEASRKQYDKHLLTQMQTLLEAAKNYVEAEKWDSASLRLGDRPSVYPDWDWRRKLGRVGRTPSGNAGDSCSRCAEGN